MISTTWPHAPAHHLNEAGAYIVTAGTYEKAHYFRTPGLLSFLQETLFTLAARYGWELQAWALFSNHYHFVALSPSDSGNLRKMLSHLHTLTAREANRNDGTPGRKVWYQFWDTLLTYQRSYFARLNYVHQNPVKHGLVAMAVDYPWCSAGWFEQKAERPFYRTVTSFKIDQVKVKDDFQVAAIEA